jgi:hypothetical protein
MIAEVQREVKAAITKNIYKVVYGGRDDQFIQRDSSAPNFLTKVDPSTDSHLTPAVMNQIALSGYYVADTTYESDLARNTPTLVYISPFGGSLISELGGTPPDGFQQVTLVTDKTPTEMLSDLTSNYHLGDVDNDHQTTLQSFNQDQLTLMYSIVVSTNPLNNLGSGWDPTSTGATRITEAIDAVDGYEPGADPSAGKDETGERIFFCQAILDHYDDQGDDARRSTLSLFHAPKTRVRCKDFYDSKSKDYTVGH